MSIFELVRPRSNAISLTNTPKILWGDGVPDTRDEFTTAPVGSLYIMVDAGSASAPLYYKSAASTWAKIPQIYEGNYITTGSAGGSAAFIK